jgi:hypothetical protein
MVVRTEDGAISLLVDEIGDCDGRGPGDLRTAPENLLPAARELIAVYYN